MRAFEAFEAPMASEPFTCHQTRRTVGSRVRKYVDEARGAHLRTAEDAIALSTTYQMLIFAETWSYNQMLWMGIADMEAACPPE